jgi:hypothetical protein
MTTIQTKPRGRKSVIPFSKMDKTQHIILQQHHFNYSDDFADQLSKFATDHIDYKNKDFKLAWNDWTEKHATIIQQEKERMKSQGYEGSVEEKMYFSARYYYRKKAIREKKESKDQEKKPQKRKKYESSEKQVLLQMSEHIILQISRGNTDTNELCTVSNMTPSNAFANYCRKYEMMEDNAQIKKIYKNLYWRISKQTKKQTLERI